jgi:hypothetical protein
VSTLSTALPRWETFLKERRTEYREMIGQKRWAPQVDAGQQSSLEPNLPAAYMVRAMMASLKQLGVDSNPATFQALVAGQLYNNKALPVASPFAVGPKTMSLPTVPPLPLRILRTALLHRTALHHSNHLTTTGRPLLL